MVESGRLRLFLVRHGEVAANRSFAFIGRCDVPLTETGVRQAQGLASVFQALAVDRVLSSPLQRCLATARPIAAAVATDLSVEDRLVEQSFGRWDGLNRAAISDLGPDDSRRLEQLRRDPTTEPPGGEPLSSVRRRVVALIDELSRGTVRSAVLVTHVSPIKAAVCEALGLPLAGVWRLFLDPASITVIDWGRTPVVRLFNGHSRLDWQQARWLGEKPVR